MKRINVTISTDGSFYLKDRVGGYAYQIKSNNGILKDWGPVDTRVSNPTEPEVIAVIHALSKLIQEDVKIHTLTINTDCEFIVRDVWNYNKTWKKVIKKLSKRLLDVLSELDYTKLNVKHVKAHSKLINNRRIANDWCDKKSREGSLIASNILHGRPINFVSPKYKAN